MLPVMQVTNQIRVYDEVMSMAATDGSIPTGTPPMCIY